MKRLRRRMTAAAAGRYVTPRNASGISAMMINALKITLARIADCGECSRMMLSARSTGNVATNIAGMIAKYFATSFAIENVVIDHVSGLFRCLRAAVHRHADVRLRERRRVVRAVARHGHEPAACLLALD